MITPRTCSSSNVRWSAAPAMHPGPLAWLAMLTALWPVACEAVEADEPPVTPITLRTTRNWPLEIQTQHVQGLAATDDFFWITSVQRAERCGWVFRVDRRTLQVVAKRRLADGDRYHPGGMQRVDGQLWLPLAEYRPRSTSVVLRLNAQSLATEQQFAVDDHLGAVAADGRGTLWAANWDCRQIYVFSADGQTRHKVDNPTGVAYQDFEWHDGLLWAAGRAKLAGTQRPIVDCVDPAAWRLRARYLLAGELRSGGDNFAREGFTKLGDTLLVLPEDGPRSTVYAFPLPAGGEP